ncbi:MAG: sodium:proton exchanger [Desulfurococcales archaeon ex4484_58]|nr:MAG: sodium:proton exchanger [Desulfurococcales archaeon ex4484_58]
MSSSILLDIALLLVVAKLFEIPFRKFHLNPLPGYIIAGFIIGPYMLGLVESTIELSGLAYLGLILLMLYTGLTTEFREMLHYYKEILITASLGVLVTFTFIYLYLLFIGIDFIVALFIAVALSNTATEAVAAIVSRKGDTVTRSIIIGASFVDDVIAVFLITILSSISIREITFVEFIMFSLKVLLFLGTIFYLSSLFSQKYPRIYSLLSKDYFWFTSIVILLALVLSVISIIVGLGGLIGAYLAGILVSRGREHHDPMLKTRIALSNFISDFTVLLDAIFIPLFFVYIGLSYSVGEVEPFLYTSLLILALAGKIAGVTPYTYSFLKDKNRSLAVGVAMCSRGSLEIVLLKLGLENGVITHSIFSTVLTVAITTTIIAPLLYTFIYKS